MFRRLVFLSFCVIVFLILCWVMYRTTLEKGTRRFIGYVSDYSSQFGMEFRDPIVEKVKIRSFDTLTAQNFTTRIRLNENKDKQHFQYFTVNIDEINLRAEELSKGRFVFYLLGLNLVAEDPLVRDAGQMKDLDRLQLDHLFMEFQLKLFNPNEIKKELKNVSKEMLRLFHKGVSSVPVKLEGESIIHFQDGTIEVRLMIEEDAEGHRLVIPAEDVEKASRILDLDLTDAEVALFRKYPLRMPKLVKIRRRAIAEAKQANAENHSVPKDAYRHVLWSYWLTKLYGPRFAEQVTEAHEKGAQNTAKEIELDRQHNSAGRDYALEGILESNLLDHMMQDETINLAIEKSMPLEGVLS